MSEIVYHTSGTMSIYLGQNLNKIFFQIEANVRTPGIADEFLPLEKKQDVINCPVFIFFSNKY